MQTLVKIKFGSHLYGTPTPADRAPLDPWQQEGEYVPKISTRGA